MSEKREQLGRLSPAFPPALLIVLHTPIMSCGPAPLTE
jgi:hypothetical protein